MTIRTIATAAAFAAALALSLVPALADTVTAKVKSWDADNKQLTLDSGEIFPIDPTKTAVPEGLAAGDTVKIDYQSNDNGVTAVYKIEKVQS